MGANAINAMLTLVSALFAFAMWLWLMRILLQLVRADFYNPVSQFIWRFTRVPTDQLRRVMRPIRRFDIASALVLYLIATIGVEVRAWLFGIDLALTMTLVLALLYCLIQLVHVYSLSLAIYCLLSWFGPGANQPASNILWSLNEPLLRPVRRILPETPGMDLSPLIPLVLLQVFAQLITPAFFR